MPTATAAPAVAEAVPEPVEPPSEMLPNEEILELTQMVQNDGSVVDVTFQPAPIPPSPTFSAPPLASLAPGESLISEPAATTAASALSSLASTLEIERLSHAPASATYLGNGSRTLEDMVIELMRPLLKSWLDQNLPQTVERLVQKEIERISRRN